MKLPKITQEPVLHVDATPDERYAIRILQAHLENTRCKWKVIGLPEKEMCIYDAMNDAQDRRAEILQKAIRILEAAKAKEEST